MSTNRSEEGHYFKNNSLQIYSLFIIYHLSFNWMISNGFMKMS